MRSLFLFISFSCILQHFCNAQNQNLSFKCEFAMISPYGEFQTTRSNGKFVKSDITVGQAINFGLVKRISDRTFVEFSMFLFSKHSLIIHQDFPDNSKFESSDIIKPKIFTLGYGYYVLKKPKLSLAFVADISFINYNDLIIASAGPPYDRTAPLDIESQNNLRGGLYLSISRKILRAIDLKFNAGILINRYQGKFKTEDDIDPLSDIDLGFNPLIVSIGFQYNI